MRKLTLILTLIITSISYSQTFEFGKVSLVEGSEILVSIPAKDNWLKVEENKVTFRVKLGKEKATTYHFDIHSWYELDISNNRKLDKGESVVIDKHGDGNGTEFTYRVITVKDAPKIHYIEVYTPTSDQTMMYYIKSIKRIN